MRVTKNGETLKNLRCLLGNIFHQAPLRDRQQGLIVREIQINFYRVNGWIWQFIPMPDEISFYRLICIGHTAALVIDVKGFYATVFFVMLFKK